LLACAEILLLCVFTGSSLEVKIETDSNDAVEIKTEADGNDISEYPCDDGLSIGTFGFISHLCHMNSFADKTSDVSEMPCILPLSFISFSPHT